MKKVVLLFLLVVGGAMVLSSCLKKEEDPQVVFQKQLDKDEAEILKFIAINDIDAVRHESGVYYSIIEPGEGDHKYTAQSKVEVKYTGRLLNGVVFDESKEETIEFNLGQVIIGWQIGMQLIQEGGKIRLIIPSGYAYGPSAYGKVPANSILDFDIELIDIK